MEFIGIRNFRHWEVFRVIFYKNSISEKLPQAEIVALYKK
jgi:hypothetical protein